MRIQQSLLLIEFFLKKLKKNSVSRLGKKLSKDTINKLSTIAINKIGIPIKVRQLSTGETKHYATLTERAKALAVTRAAIKKALKFSRLIKKDYSIKYLNKKV